MEGLALLLWCVQNIYISHCFVLWEFCRTDDHCSSIFTFEQLLIYTGPDSSSDRASASGSEGRRLDPRPRHTKGVKNGTGSSLADARNKRVVPGRYKKAGKYLLRIFVMSHNSS